MRYLAVSPIWQILEGPWSFNKSQPLKYWGQNKRASMVISLRANGKSFTVNERLLFRLQFIGTSSISSGCNSSFVTPELHDLPDESTFRNVSALKSFCIFPLPIPVIPLA